MTVQYTAFGEMAVVVDGVRQPLTRRRERGVLSVLLANHGAPVAAERLVAEVWGDDAPGQTLASLQVAVSRLRSLLEPDRAARKGSRLVSTAAGYSLVARPEDVDTWAFESTAELAVQAETAEERLLLSDRARAWWTSTPYADCDSPAAATESSRLEELLLTVEEQRARALIDLGRPDEAQRALAELAPRHAYRERLWSLLALAQYQCARQADALETLRRLRERLADDLGVDPSEEIQRLEQAVLRQDPSLTEVAPAPPAMSVPAPRVTLRASLAPEPRSGTVGRQPVLDEVAGVLEAAGATGTTRFLLVAGEPGIGKSRLVSDLDDVAAAAGFQVLVGRSHEGDYAPALWPWLGIVRTLAAQLTTQQTAEQSTELDPLLVPLLEAEAGDPAEGSGTGLRMFDAVVELIGRSAHRRPLLLVLEDIHWADASSLRLLAHLATSSPDQPLAVVCTRRTTEATTGPALVDAMAALARAGADRVRLDGLDAASVGQLLEDAVGPHAPALDAMVAEVTGGNPFFVLQYARLLAGLPDLERVDPTALPVPDGIRDVLHQRIQRLPDEAVRLLTAAAVLGHRIDPDTVAELSDTPVEECLDLLDLSMTSGLVEEQDTAYAFVHALARETIYGQLSAARRMRLHDRAGQVIEQRDLPHADASATIAHHAHLAAPLSTAHAERACHWLEQAAGVATARHAHAESLDLWLLAEADSPSDSVLTLEAKCGAAAALLRLARTVEGRTKVEEAVQLGKQLGRWDLVARAAAIVNGAGVWSWREHGIQDDAFIGMLTEATAHVDDPERARLLAALQMEHFYGWDSAVADKIGAESVEVARRCHDTGLLIEVLLVRIIATWGPDRAPLRLELIDEVLGYGPTGELRVFVLFQLATALYEVFEPERADEAMAQCASEAAALRHTGVEIPLAWWWFARARDLDDPAADDLGEAAFELHRNSGYIAGVELECLVSIRGPGAGGPVPDEVIELGRDANPGLRAMVAHAVLEAGDPETAYGLLGEPAPPGASEYSVLAGHCLALLVLSESGTAEEITEALARVLPYAGQSVTYGTVDHLGAADHYLASGYAALGDPRALEHARRAVVLNERLQCAPWLRRSEALLARLSS